VLKLSEAIRLGSMVHPQYFGAMFRFNYRGPAGEPRRDIVGSCALGAAAVASGMDNTLGAFPYLDEKVKRPPNGVTFPPKSSPYECSTLCQCIVYLNDGCHWSRERIADWVEEVERQFGIGESKPVEKAVEEEVVNA